MKIVVNGDSFTHERHFAVGEDYIEKTWAHSIGAKNIALGGCSNERIFYSTIEYLNEYKPDVLIIGWTGFDRCLMTHTNGLNLHIAASSVGDNLLRGFNFSFEDLVEIFSGYISKPKAGFLISF